MTVNRQRWWFVHAKGVCGDTEWAAGATGHLKPVNVSAMMVFCDARLCRVATGIGHLKQAILFRKANRPPEALSEWVASFCTI